MTDPTDPGKEHRLLETLERLLEITASDLRTALTSAADLVAEALHADKVDVFLYDAARDSLVALGSSNQPLSAQEKSHGLDVLPIANGGRAVHVFKTGNTFLTGNLGADPEEVRGVKEVLKIRSKVGVPLEVGGTRRGMLMIAAKRPDFFSEADARFAENIAHWVALVIHRAELVDAISRTAVEQGRRDVAEELITTLAHDLRNYLSPIDLRLNILRRRAEREGRGADTRDLDLALKGLARFRAIIADILDVARIDQGLLQIAAEPIDLITLLQDLASTLSRPEQAIDLQVAEDVLVVGDVPRLQQCIENILSNALKFAPRDTAVVVKVSRVRAAHGTMAQVEIIDQGPGVAPEVLPRIFERFVTSGLGDGGLGLGLYLARRIAVLHGGDLTVESEPGKGARFLLTLPGPAEA